MYNYIKSQIYVTFFLFIQYAVGIVTYDSIFRVKDVRVIYQTF